MRRFLLASLLALGGSFAVAGPYDAHGISATDPSLVGWATGFSNLVRGPQSIDNPGGSLASFGSGAMALGSPGGSLDAVSLGDGGQITLSFATPITNGIGADLAVFEQGFQVGSKVFAELGFVEVSSNGTDFFRFDSVSLTQTATQVGSFEGIDPTDIHNLAGQFVAFEGTRFDLDELAGVSPLLDVNRITEVRVIDVVGSINPLYARHDSLGNVINDPWKTPFASGGFDLDAVGVIHPVPEPSSLVVLALGGLAWRRRKRA